MDSHKHDARDQLQAFASYVPCCPSSPPDRVAFTPPALSAAGLTALSLQVLDLFSTGVTGTLPPEWGEASSAWRTSLQRLYLGDSFVTVREALRGLRILFAPMSMYGTLCLDSKPAYRDNVVWV